ncbi:hypothetical protein Msil_1498 [Methylocella silvestris BL2]|uniref:Uncharacterized protein n=2 Tax=Methylocella silvestris TaxID=199596 RepID=B8ESW4_METSB|nr:hypothetical protein Msil_1498 [Methylocella silvestris BL2]
MIFLNRGTVSRIRGEVIMSGASSSNEDMVTGRTNRAEGRTILWADVPPDQSNFNGPAIMIVETAQSPEDPDDYDDGQSFQAANQYDGLRATGWSGGSASNFGGTPGGTGVVGRGGRNQGTGVQGVGGGVPEPGNGGAGGIGVHGLGGSQADFFADPTTPPGAGLVGQGGRQSAQGNTAQQPHAAGVIGIAGGTGRSFDALPAHTLTETGGVGVYGQGAEATTVMVPPVDADGNSTSGPNVPSGPAAAGPGVLGRGGVADMGPAAAGVVGVAGGVGLPGIGAYADAGVYGEAGVGRGGVFKSGKSAQLMLAPRKAGVRFNRGGPATPHPVANERVGLRLPKDGKAGDLIALLDDTGECGLWFCVREGNGAPAQWAEVLLGPAFAGA